MSLQTQLSTGLVLPTFRPAWKRFRELSQGTPEDLALQQEAMLKSYLQENKETRFGREHGFANIFGTEQYHEAVPLANPEAYHPYISAIAAGEQNVLTAAAVKRLEPTSGTAAGSRLIPYTAPLAAEFRQALNTWLYDLYAQYPQLAGGRSYWSITPVGDRPERSAGGLPIGFDDDLAYFGKLTGRLLSPLFVGDPALARETDMEAFFFKTCLALINAGDLRLLSFWNPSLLLRLFDYMQEEGPRLNRALPLSRRQAFQNAWAFNEPALLWPFLTVISCWTDAAADTEAEKLKRLFPDVHLQPKGLLATEAFFSIPWEETPGDPVLAASSHYFEFEDPDSGQVTLSHELRTGSRYRVYATTGGGFYRYTTGDIIEVSGHLGPLPRFRLLGRGDLTSDLHGEKLTEAFVLAAFAELQEQGSGDLLLLPHPDGTHYVLLAEDAGPAEDLASLAVQTDRLLRRNYHYDYCRRLGQLGSVEALRLAADWQQHYLRKLSEEGSRVGDVKPPALLKDAGWLEVLRY